MVMFTDEMLNYIKAEMGNVVKLFENGKKKEIKEYIDNVGGIYIDCVLMFCGNHTWTFFEDINKNKYFNDEIVNFCWYGLGMWVWNESNMEMAEEVHEYVDNEIYCKIYEHIIFTLKAEEIETS
jgi:tryptophan synthase beta subunit